MLLVQELRDEMHDVFKKKVGEEEYDAAMLIMMMPLLAIHKDVRQGIIEDEYVQMDVNLYEVRPLSTEVGLLPRAHGSSLFTRGLTQALNIVTLAPLSYVQLVDTMEKEGERRYLHHYNAPGYTVGEVRRLRESWVVVR